MTIEEVRKSVATKATTATAVAEQHYARITAEDGPSGKNIHSFLALSEKRAMEQAAKIDAMAAKGDALPPLAGVPVGIKDVLTMVGSPATAGSKILQGYMPPYDATAVKKLEAAGAVLLGKLNCDEFAMGSSNENSAYGPVLNPRALDRVPGGSSGGSAAAVAAGFAVATLGTDTGGSIRQPAAFCGVVGMLPTYGRVSRYGLIAFASSLDRVGPFATNVRDAATMLSVLAGKDVLDATSSDRPVGDYVGALAKPVAGLRIGVPAEYFGEGLDPEIRAAIEKALDGLRAAGCEVKTIALPHTKYAIPTYYVIATAEASANLSRFDGVRFGLRAPGVQTLSQMYRTHARPGLRRGGEAQDPAGDLCAFSGLLRRLLPQGTAGSHAVDARFSGGVQRGRRDCVAGDSYARFKLGAKTDDPVQMYLEDIYSVAASLAGICGMSVPCGETAAGLPIGVQVMGRHFDEETMLRVGLTIEAMQT